MKFIADNKNKVLHLGMLQRSADLFLGVPFNIASASLFLTIMAKLSGFTAGIFTHYLNDCHIYKTHLEGVKEQLNRQPHALPTLSCTMPSYEGLPPQNFAEFILPSHFSLENYTHGDSIKAAMAV